MLKKFLMIDLFLVVLAYLLAMLHFFIPFYLVWVLLAYTCMITIIVFTWWLYIPQVKRCKPKTSITLIAFGSLMLVLFGKYAIEQHYFSNSSSQIRIAAKIILLIASVILGGNLIKKSSPKTTGTCLILCVILILLSPLYGVISKSKNQEGNTSLTTKQLLTFPYVSRVSVENSEQNGVTKYLPEKTYPGFNLYASVVGNAYYLIDMNGKVVNTWPAKNQGAAWHDAAKLDRNGDLLSIGYQKAPTRQNWDGSIKWVNNKIRIHHDIDIASNGDIYTLERYINVFLKSGVPFVSGIDYLLIFSPAGSVKKKISLIEVLKPFIKNKEILRGHEKLIRLSTLKNVIKTMLEGRMKIEGGVFDMFHNNTVSIINRNIEGLCKKGNVLICPRNLDLIAIMDVDTEKLLWTMKLEEYSRPHNPTLLDNGNILLFDNGPFRGYSRILEIDPLKKKIVWQYQADPPEKFFSRQRGGCQRLPNGNTLITEGGKGHVFEITSEGEIVWEFYNPDVVDGQRGTMQNMIRIIDVQNYPHLKQLKN